MSNLELTVNEIYSLLGIDLHVYQIGYVAHRIVEFFYNGDADEAYISLQSQLQAMKDIKKKSDDEQNQIQKNKFIQVLRNNFFDPETGETDYELLADCIVNKFYNHDAVEAVEDWTNTFGGGDDL